MQRLNFCTLGGFAFTLAPIILNTKWRYVLQKSFMTGCFALKPAGHIL